MLQRTPGTFYVLTHHRGPAPLNTALGCMKDMPRLRIVGWLVVVLAVALLVLEARTFVAVDRCLDSGGSFDHELFRCDHIRNHPGRALGGLPVLGVVALLIGGGLVLTGRRRHAP